MLHINYTADECVDLLGGVYESFLTGFCHGKMYIVVETVCQKCLNFTYSLL